MELYRKYRKINLYVVIAREHDSLSEETAPKNVNRFLRSI